MTETTPQSKRILFFDVMDTLVVDPFFQSIPEFFGLTLEQLLKQKHPDSWIAFEEAKISEAEYMKTFFSDQRDVDGARLRQLLWDSYSWIDGVELLLAELHAAGFEMHAVSNYSIWYRIIEERLKLSRFLDWTFVSCRTGLRKPVPRCYQFALDTLAARPSDCLFVDDRSINVEAAQAMGIDSIQFVDSAQLRNELKNRELI